MNQNQLIQQELNPQITVVMPVYNGEKYLDTAIKSILNQTFTNFEFVIVDDASTDSSVRIINSYKDKRIKLIQNNVNLGIPTTRNKCLQESSGEYIAVLDCDDYAYPSRLAEQFDSDDARSFTVVLLLLLLMLFLLLLLVVVVEV
jgi:glycosyltransferase involved in cell wall biosynthesis